MLKNAETIKTGKKTTKKTGRILPAPSFLKIKTPPKKAGKIPQKNYTCPLPLAMVSNKSSKKSASPINELVSKTSFSTVIISILIPLYFFIFYL